MFAKILKGNQNFIPILIFILWLVGFFFMNLNDLQLRDGQIIAALLAIAAASGAWVVNSFPYFKENFYPTFIVAILFLCISCCFNNLPFFAGLFFLFVVLNQILFKNQQEFYLFNSFDLGFFMGFAIMFYPPFWIFGIYLLLHFMILGKTQILNFIFALLGLVAFAILAIELMAVFDMWHFGERFLNGLDFNWIDLKQSYWFLVPIFLLGVLSLIDYYSHLNRQSVNKKLVFFDAFMWFIHGMVFLILYAGSNSNSLLVLVIPIALYISNYLTHNKVAWQKETALWVLVVCLALYRFHYLIDLPELFDQVTF